MPKRYLVRINRSVSKQRLRTTVHLRGEENPFKNQNDDYSIECLICTWWPCGRLASGTDVGRRGCSSQLSLRVGETLLPSQVLCHLKNSNRKLQLSAGNASLDAIVALSPLEVSETLPYYARLLFYTLNCGEQCNGLSH